MTAAELEKRKQTNLKIIKFGCLPIVGIFLIIIMLSIFNTPEKKDYRTLIQDFCNQPEDSLNIKYGTPKNSVWEVDGVKVNIINFENVRNINFQNIKLDPQKLETETGFDMGFTRQGGPGITALHFFKSKNEAVYNSNNNSLRIAIY